MDNFTYIYKILKELERAMDYDELDISRISHERLKISYQRWEKILILLSQSSYITGIVYDQTASEYSPHLVEPVHPSITLRGLEYLNNNALMKKAANLIKGIKDMVPGL